MAPSTFLTEETAPLLRTSSFGRTMRGYDTVSSTNVLAARWAAEGAPEGSVVTAEHQEHGRGRQGRIWFDERGKNLLVSVILRPDIPTDQRALLSLMAAVALADALDEFVQPHEIELKWPNDLLLDERKCGGLLLESSFNGTLASFDAAVVLGIGLNVNQTDIPPELSERATSLLLATGRPVCRPALLARILKELEERYRQLHADGASFLLQAFHERLLGRDSEITLYRHKTLEPIRGTVLGITAEGALRLQLPNGEQVFHAGDVTTHAPN